MKRFLIASLFALIAGSALAQDAAPTAPAPKTECVGIDKFQAKFPTSDFKAFTQAQFDFFKSKLAEANVILPESITKIYLTAAINDPETLVLLGFSDKECYVGHMNMPVAAFAQMLGAMPKASQSSSSGHEKPWNGEV